MYDMEQFSSDCENIGICLTELQLFRFQKYYELLMEWNSFMNLTAITEYEEVLKKHFLDSLSIVKVVSLFDTQNIIDIGSGAGFPGIPIKIAFPHLKMTLLDSLEKRIKFLNTVIEELSLKNINTIHGRAEEFAGNKEYRENFDIVVSRAVANLSILSEYCIPYIKIKGRFISYKSGNIQKEVIGAKKAISILGGQVEQVYHFKLGTAGERSFIVIRKENFTPIKYPRKAGTPSRNPL